jgi:hypothetical protein
MKVENGIPLETNLQVYFTDASYTVLDSMFKDDAVFLEPATLGLGGKVTNLKSFTNIVEFSSADLVKLKQAKFARVKASINTPQNGTIGVPFYSYYGIDFKLSAKTDLRINSKNL